MSRSIRRTLFAVLASITLALPADIQSQETNSQLTAETFRQPPPEIADAVLAPRHLNRTLDNPSPDGQFFLNETDDGAPTMAMFAKPFHRLGGMQLDWGANRDRNLTIRSGVGLIVTERETARTITIDIPDGARVSSATWSPDGSRIAFFAHFADGTQIFVADPTTGRSRQVTRSPVLATLHTSFAWMPDSRRIATVLVPQNRGGAPVEPAVPAGPQVRLTTPETNRIRTYPDLLETPHEKALLEYYGTGQLAVVDVERRSAVRLGAPAMIQDVDVSPDGGYALVTTMRKPFSYVVPTRQFGSAIEIRSLQDGSVVRTVSQQDVRDGSPSDTSTSTNTDPRDFSWRPDGGLSFLQLAPQPQRGAQEEEEQGEGRRARRQDRVMQSMPPFDESAQTVVYTNDTRLSNVQYSADARTLFLSEQQGERAHDFAVLLSDPDTKHTIWRGERRGFRGGPTPRLLTTTLANGVEIIRTTENGASAFLSGTEYHDDPTMNGPQPYIDRIEIASGEKTRVYESDNDGVYERVLAVLNDDATELLVERESPTDHPNSYYRHVGTGVFRQLTDNTDYTADLTRAQRRRYAVTRVDGLEFAVDVTLPERWQGERMPGVIWFYPREYTGQDDYDETRARYNKNAFPNLRARSMDVLVRLGYAVIEPDAPIIGDRGRMNDNYVHDLRNNLSATIDFLDKEGIIDRERLGVGGHSYGAFSTVNAMVHTPFFKAGIAGDGNFNRTLTPFSFQSERRSLWEAKDVYFSMSPLFYAHNLSGALLMYHGEHDQNVGTFPINSWRLFESLESLGKTGSLYVYPFEDHGPATQETLLDLWARWSAWLDKYVKNAGKDEAKVTAGAM